MRKSKLLLIMMLSMFAVIPKSAGAFSDTKSDPNTVKIAALQEQGILAGNQSGTYNPKEQLTFSAGISIVVNGLGLNMNHVNFIKEPLASDFYPQAKNNAWYSKALVIAANNDLDLPKDLDPSASMTKEQFAHLVFRAILNTGNYSLPEPYVRLNDKDAVTPSYMDSIQKLVILHIATLDNKSSFSPKSIITRSEAAGWLYDAIQYTKKNPSPSATTETAASFPLSELSLSVKAITPAVNEVIITAQAPNPGYGMRIASITFSDDKAVISIVPTHPKEDMMYPQVITPVKIITYVDAKYKPVLETNSN